MEYVSFRLEFLKVPLILGVEYGTGHKRNVYNVHKDGSSTITKHNVCQYLIIVIPIISLENVRGAIEGIKLFREDAWLINNLSSHLIQDVKFGTGLNKYVFNAPTDGSLTKMVDASRLMIFVMVFPQKLENVHLATKVINCLRDNA